MDRQHAALSTPTLEPLPPDLRFPSAKRAPEDKVGVAGWLPFHAAFSGRFAKAAIRALPESGLLIDPYGGSGTTLRWARSLGRRAVSLDLNPALVALAQAACSSREAADGGERWLAAKLPSLGVSSKEGSDWLHPAVAGQLAEIRAALVAELTSEEAAFVRGVLVRSARDLALPKTGTNPTWPRPRLKRRRVDVGKILGERAKQMAADIRAAAAIGQPLQALQGDARSLPFSTGSISSVLTSPPYLSRIDYVQATMPELAVLGMDGAEMVDRLRKAVVGGVLSRPGEAVPSPPAVVAKLMSQIRSHGSKASKTYYARLAERYFVDLDASIGELSRVLAPGGTALVVVQTSYYKDVLIELPEIVRKLGSGKGLDARVHQTEIVRIHYGRLSPHQRKYVEEKTLNECVVSLRKPPA